MSIVQSEYVVFLVFFTSYELMSGAIKHVLLLN